MKYSILNRLLWIGTVCGVLAYQRCLYEGHRKVLCNERTRAYAEADKHCIEVMQWEQEAHRLESIIIQERVIELKIPAEGI